MNTFNPGFTGTVIGKSTGEEKFAIKGISSIDDISVLLLQGSGLMGVAGISKRLFGALANGKINVILISQASSVDVARKLLILVREAGYKLEMEDIQLESLVPAEMSLSGSVEEFLLIL